MSRLVLAHLAKLIGACKKTCRERLASVNTRSHTVALIGQGWATPEENALYVWRPLIM